MTRTIIHSVFLALAIVAAVSTSVRAATQAELWDAIKSGEAIAMMRHALAPGTGDPQNFTLGDCTTQRNLSDEGRQQAQRIGQRFIENGIASATVMTSQWCRCRDTAELLGLGAPQDLPALNSFFANRGDRDSQTEALKAWLTENRSNQPLVLVTHQVNITALTGVFPKSGEIVVFSFSSEGDVSVIGQIEN